jgi:folate-binding protein YgfZ
MKLFLFPSPCIISISGKDSLRYLNGRLSTNVKKLKNGTASLTCILNAQGKVLSFGTLLKRDDEKYLYISENKNHDELNHIKQFVVAERIVFEDLTSSVTTDSMPSQLSSKEEKNQGNQQLLRSNPENDSFHNLFHLDFTEEEADKLDKYFPSTDSVTEDQNTSLFPFFSQNGLCIYKRQRIGKYGIDVMSPTAHYSSCQKLIDEIYPNLTPSPALMTFEVFNQERLLFGSLSSTCEITEKYIPIELGLIKALDNNKGCYVGQEVIEKLLSFAKAPKKIVRIVCEAPSDHFTISNYMFTFDKETSEYVKVGKVLSASLIKKTFYGFGEIQPAKIKDYALFIAHTLAEKRISYLPATFTDTFYY